MKERKTLTIISILIIAIMTVAILISWISKEKNFNHGVCSKCEVNLELKDTYQAAEYYQCPKCKKVYTHYHYF